MGRPIDEDRRQTRNSRGLPDRESRVEINQARWSEAPISAAPTRRRSSKATNPPGPSERYRATVKLGASNVLADKVVVVTGANCGIGEATAVALAGMGATTVLACRNRARADAAAARVKAASGRDRIDVVELDLADLDAVRAAADDILGRFDRLDVLVNNTGGLSTERRATRQGFEQTFGVNHLGPFLLTSLLLDRLRRSAPSRIVNVSSVGHRYARGMNWDDLQLEHGYDAFTAYGQSKLANILFTRALAQRLPAGEVTANACHPGSVRTELGRDGDTSGFLGVMSFRVLRPLYLSAARGARTQIYLASAPELRDKTGGYYVRRREHQPSRAARDDAAAERLWDVSERLVGLSEPAG